MSQIFLPILYTALFVLLIQKVKFFDADGLPRKWIQFIFLLKISAGTAVWFIYTHFYTDRLTADIFKYFDDGLIMYSALFHQPLDYFKMLLGIPDPSLNHYLLDDMRHWTREFGGGLYNENRTMIRFNALADLFSFGNYHVHTVFMCFLSFMGLMGICKTFLPFLQDKKWELFAAIFLLPSVLFWGSGVLKEGLVLFSLGMLIYHLFKLLHEKITLKRSAAVLFFLVLLAASKLYVFLVALPVLIAHAFVTLTGNKLAALKYAAALTLLLCSALLIPKFDLPYMLMDKQAQAIYMARGGSYLGNKEENKFVYISPDIENRIIRLNEQPGYCKIVQGVPYMSWHLDTDRDSTFVQNSSDTLTYWIYNDGPAAGSLIHLPFLQDNFASIAKISPLAFFNVLFRPFLTEGKNPLMLLSAVENFVIAICILICIVFYTRKNPNKHLIYFCFSLVILLFTLIGLTTPILGAIVRYKIPVLPFLMIGLLLIMDKNKLMQRFSIRGT